MQFRILAPIALLSFLLGACSDNEPVKVAPAPTTAATPASSLPPGHPTAVGKPLEFTMPEGWISEKPSVSMRREQYKLAKSGADSDDATVTVSVLTAGEGGTKDDNLARWAGQFEQPDGKSPLSALQQKARKLNGMDVLDLDISGTYVAPVNMAAGTNERFNKPGWRMLLSWIQSDHGSYYVKVIGPAGTVAHWEPSFRKFVDSAKPAGG